jgi:hypothetical protein
MNTQELRHLVTDLCLHGIIRCLKENANQGEYQFYRGISNTLNLEILRYYWALSDDIEEVASTVLESPRRLTTAITYDEVERFGEITGSINAGATVLAQARTLNPTLFVVLEPNSTAHSEPNQLVAWILSEALHILLSARRVYKPLNRFEWFHNKLSLLENAMRNEMLRDIISTSTGRKRPTQAVLRAASKARVPIYQVAIQAFDLLENIEKGQEEAIMKCLSQTLIASLEYWQRLELATALQAAQALSVRLKEPVQLSFPFVAGRPIAKIGCFQVYWQYSVPQRPDEKLELTERWAREIAKTIGVNTSDSRADIAICLNDQVISIFECKYFESRSSAAQAIVDASIQLSRYARDLFPDSVSEAEELIANSGIIVAQRYSYGATSFEEETGTYHRLICFLDIEGLKNNALWNWADQLLLRYLPTSAIG